MGKTSCYKKVQVHRISPDKQWQLVSTHEYEDFKSTRPTRGKRKIFDGRNNTSQDLTGGRTVLAHIAAEIWRERYLYRKIARPKGREHPDENAPNDLDMAPIKGRCDETHAGHAIKESARCRLTGS
jgi:hypothetical protein